MFFRLTLGALAAGSLAACSSGPLKFRPTMGADPSEIGYEA